MSVKIILLTSTSSPLCVINQVQSVGKHVLSSTPATEVVTFCIIFLMSNSLCLNSRTDCGIFISAMISRAGNETGRGGAGWGGMSWDGTGRTEAGQRWRTLLRQRRSRPWPPNSWQPRCEPLIAGVRTAFCSVERGRLRVRNPVDLHYPYPPLPLEHG